MDNSNTGADTQANISKLYSLRQSTLNSLLPVIQEASDIDPERKFDIYLSAIHESHDPAIIEQALAAANSISDQTAKSDALMDLIQEINYSINAEESSN